MGKTVRFFGITVIFLLDFLHLFFQIHFLFFMDAIDIELLSVSCSDCWYLVGYTHLYCHKVQLVVTFNVLVSMLWVIGTLPHNVVKHA